MNDLEEHLLRELTKQRILNGTIATRIVMTRTGAHTFRVELVRADNFEHIITIFEEAFPIGHVKLFEAIAIVKTPPPTEG